MRYITVATGAMKAVWPVEDIALTAGGVSTCICILAEGEIDGIDYLAMYHWDGFPPDFNGAKTQKFIFGIYQQLAKHIATMGYSDEKPTLSKVHTIGGQRREPDLSGTEAEVDALLQYSMQACAAAFHVQPTTQYIHQHYLTEQSGMLRVYFSKHGMSFEYNDSFDSDMEYDESEEDTSSPIFRR